MSTKSRLLLLLTAGAVAIGLQLPRIIALARFDARSAPVHHTEGQAWGAPRGRKGACTVRIQRPQGGGVTFGCDALPWPGPWVIDGAAAASDWILAPYDDFGGDVPVPLEIVQGPKIIVKGDAADRMRDLWGHLISNVAWTLGAAVVVMLLVLVDAWRERARVERPSRDARERRRVR